MTSEAAEGHEGWGVSPSWAAQPHTWQAAGDSWPSLVNTRNTLQITVKSTWTPPQISKLPVGVVLPQVGTTTLLNVQKKKKKTLALQTQGKLLSAGWANGKWDRTLKMYLITEWYLRVEGEMGSRKNDILWMKNEYFQEGGLKEDLLPCSYNPARFSFNILP